MSSVGEVLQRHLAGAAERAVPAVGELRRIALVPTVRATSEAQRQITFVASTESVDRYGDIIRVSGWQTANYMKNPVVLWAHRSSEPPVGRTISLTTESNPPALVQVVEFADKATYPFADTVYNLYKNGFLKSVSVGFRPTEKPKPIRDPDTDQITGFEFTKQELLELSCVPLPANPDAVARAIEAGLVRQGDVPKFFAESQPADTTREELILELCRVVRTCEFATLELALQKLRANVLLKYLLDGKPGASKAKGIEELLAAERRADDEIVSLEQLESALRGK